MMNKNLLALCALLLAVPANAQPGGGPPPDGGPPGGRPPRMKQIKPVTRDRFDSIVTAMFRSADGDRNGLVTLDEIRAIARARRDILIGKRFERIDTNNDRSISSDEFSAWQQGLGSVAQSEEAQAIGRDELVPETIEPEYDNEMEAHLLRDLVEPMNARLVVDANSDYDAGLSLEELLTYEGKRFEQADRNRNGAISMDEAHRPKGRFPGDAPGPPPVRVPVPLPDNP